MTKVHAHEYNMNTNELKGNTISQMLFEQDKDRECYVTCVKDKLKFSNFTE